MDQPIPENTPNAQPSKYLPKSSQAQQSPQTDEPHLNESHYAVGGLIALVFLVIAGGFYTFFVLPKTKPTSKMTYRNYTVPSPQLTQEPTAAYTNPFVSPTQAYSNPFDASGSPAVTDTPYQNPFGN